VALQIIYDLSHQEKADRQKPNAINKNKKPGYPCCKDKNQIPSYRMSSALSSPFMADTIQEVVPDVVKVAGRMAASSVITGRRRVRLVPQSGQNYTSGASSGIINILIQDGQAYADLLSACLSFNVTTYDSANAVAANATPTAAATCVLDDGAYSVFRRALVSVNSTLMDDIDVLPKKVNAELYATCSQAWYNTVGSFIGLWKHSTVTPKPTNAAGVIAGTGDTFLSKYDVSSKAVEQAKKTQGTGAVASAATASAAFQPGQNQFSVPVSLLTSFFRNDTLFPSRNAGQLYLQLNLASAVESMLCAGPNAPVPSYSITNLTCEIEYVDLHSTFLSLMDDLIEAPSGAGVNWAFDAHLCTSQSVGSGPGQKSVIVSKASQNMRSLHVVAQPDSALASPQWLSQSTFQNPGLVDIQLRIGSLYYPAFPAIGEHRAYMDLQNAFGSPESTDKSGIIDTVSYYTNTPDTFAAATGGALAQVGTGVAAPRPIPLQNNLGALVVSAIPRSAWVDNFMYAYCFDRLKHAKFHGLDLDGKSYAACAA